MLEMITHISTSPWHSALHVLTILVAITLAIISAISYLRNRRLRFMLVAAAFLIFCVKEIITISNPALMPDNPYVILTHVLNLIVLGLFASALLKLKC